MNPGVTENLGLKPRPNAYCMRIIKSYTQKTGNADSVVEFSVTCKNKVGYWKHLYPLEQISSIAK